MQNDAVIAKYVTDLQPLYRLFSAKVQELVSSILAANQIRPHSVTYREKSPASLDEKISRGGKSYEDPLHQVTDLAGVRVITYFPTDVDRVVPLLEGQFVVDGANSVDKRMTTDPSAFGYASVHLVVELTAARCELPEYAMFKGLKCEIQVRTILQHAWAEIEHDIAYKSSEEIPFELRRKFASLAGLLEVADREFEMLRREESKVREDIRQTIGRDNLDIPIDLESLGMYLEKYHDEEVDRSGIRHRLGLLVRMLADTKIKSLAGLHSVLTPAALAAADKRVARLPCEIGGDPRRCLLRYFIAVGEHEGVAQHLIARCAGCPALADGSPDVHRAAAPDGNGKRGRRPQDPREGSVPRPPAEPSG